MNIEVIKANYLNTRHEKEIAISKGCCKITLEILSNNESAKAAYKKFGFSNYELDPRAGVGLFWQKRITEDKKN